MSSFLKDGTLGSKARGGQQASQHDIQLHLRHCCIPQTHSQYDDYRQQVNDEVCCYKKSIIKSKDIIQVNTN